MPSSLGPAEILVILVVALIVLGPKRLPEAGRQVGKALSEIRRWSQDVKYEMNQAFNPEVVVRDPTPLAEPGPPAAQSPSSTAPVPDPPDPLDRPATSEHPEPPGPAAAQPEGPEAAAPSPEAPADDNRS